MSVAGLFGDYAGAVADACVDVEAGFVAEVLATVALGYAAARVVDAWVAHPEWVKGVFAATGCGGLDAGAPAPVGCAGLCAPIAVDGFVAVARGAGHAAFGALAGNPVLQVGYRERKGVVVVAIVAVAAAAIVGGRFAGTAARAVAGWVFAIGLAVAIVVFAVAADFELHAGVWATDRNAVAIFVDAVVGNLRGGGERSEARSPFGEFLAGRHARLSAFATNAALAARGECAGLGVTGATRTTFVDVAVAVVVRAITDFRRGVMYRRHAHSGIDSAPSGIRHAGAAGRPETDCHHRDEVC